MGTGHCVVALYKAKPNMQKQLEMVLKKHVSVLRKCGFATERQSIVLQSLEDGTFIEIFEWNSAKSIDEAHSDKRVKEVWDEFENLAEHRKLQDLSESKVLFPVFRPLDHLVNE